jgi:molybdopterin-guanine dinucleotide biosynthesis protein B
MRVIGIAGWSGAGKTTLITKVLPVLIARGLKVATVKHAHHGFDTDRPGKDSWAHREAGACEVAVVSPLRWAILHELHGEREPTLGDIVARLSPADLVLVEGYKRDLLPKLEVHRALLGKPLMQPQDNCIVAIASDTPMRSADVPVLDLGDVEAIADLIEAKAVPCDRIAVAPQ